MKRPLNIHSIVLSQRCSKCDNWAAKIEMTEPNSYPKEAATWSEEELAHYEKYRDFDSTYLTYSGPGGSSGDIGNPIDEERKKALINAFTEPFDSMKIKEQFYDMAGYCNDCKKFYCATHWNTSAHGYGKCPDGHGKTLDPHWSPDVE